MIIKMSLIQTSRMKSLITHVHLVTINKSMTLHWFIIYLHISLLTIYDIYQIYLTFTLNKKGGKISSISAKKGEDFKYIS